MTRRRYVGLSLSLATALSCTGPASRPTDSESAASSAADQSPAATEAELTEAHRAALARAIPLAVKALTLDQPIRSGAAGVAPLAGPGWFGTRRTIASEQLAAALKELREIDSERLDPLDVQVLIGLRFALERARLHTQAPFMSFDPTWITRKIGLLLAEVEHLQVSSGCTEDTCAVALRDAVFGLQGAQRGLRRTSAAALDGGLEDLRAIDGRLVRLRRSVDATATEESTATTSIASAIEAMRAELGRVRGAWETRRDGLGDLVEEPWTALDKKRPPTSDFRLPDVIDSAVMRRILGREEHVEDSARNLLGSASRNLARLRAMKSLAAKAAPASPAPLSLDRCVALRTRLREALTNATPSPVSCEALVAWHAGDTLTDDAVLLQLLEHSVTAPERRQRWRAQPTHVRLVAGEMAPRAHRWISLIGYAHATSLPGLESLAIDGAARDLCRASAALLRHGEVPVRAPRRGEARAAVEVHTQDSARTWLRERCPDAPTDDLWSFATQHPWEALFGGGMVLLNSEPYIMAGLDAFWWTPLGLTISFAIPDAAKRRAPRASDAAPAAAAADDGGIKVTVENL